jgi:hypothetical protein
MRGAPQVVAAAVGLVALGTSASGEIAQPGQEEFGLTRKELVQSIERVEALIAQCMREHGFEYVPADYATVRRGMNAIMSLPGLDEEDFIAEHGFGIATLYTGQPPQLVEGYSPARVGLGERNVEIFRKLPPADQVAYNRALLGRNTQATFAVAIDIEDFSQCGGCTLAAIEQVFRPEQLTLSYYNPKDALIDRDPRMKEALREYAHEMSKAGFHYGHPEEVEEDVRERLAAITQGATIPLDELSPAQRDALKELQDYERRVSVVNYRLEEEILDEVEDRIEEELFPRKVK